MDHDVAFANAIYGNIAIGVENLMVGQNTGIFFQYDNNPIKNKFQIRDVISSTNLGIATGIFYN